MKRGSQYVRWFFLTAVLASSMAGLGCAEHHYRVYDPYYTDYHEWNSGETVYYRQWAAETHHDPHRDFRKLHDDEKKDYWTWRHNHGDHH